MSSPSSANSKKLPETRWGDLPPFVDALLITGSTRLGRSLAQAFAADSAVEVRLDEAIGVSQGLGRLRERVYDVVLVCHDEVELDAPSVLDAIHTASSDIQPILVLGLAADQEIAAVCYEAGADAYLCVHTTTTRTLLWQIARARERRQLLLDNQRLQLAHRQRQSWEEDEAARLLEQQRRLLQAEDATSADAPPSSSPGRSRLPEALVAEYYELLRAYVVMGSGHLGAALEHWTKRVAAQEASSREILDLHLRSVEQVLEGLGSRSARHVLNRADLLIVEVLMHVTDLYRSSRTSDASAPR